MLYFDIKRILKTRGIDEPYRWLVKNGFVPQTVIFDANGKVQLDEVGNTPYEKIDDTLRSMFDLLPRDTSQVLTRRRLNDVNIEMSK